MTVDTASETTLYRIVYCSRNKVGPADGQVGQVESILAASRRNNALAGITGALLFNSGVFAQVLEGPLRRLESTFERIQRDERHGDVQVLTFNPVTDRRFPLWSMGYVGKSAPDDLFASIGVDTNFDIALLEGDRILELLASLALDGEDEGLER